IFPRRDRFFLHPAIRAGQVRGHHPRAGVGHFDVAEEALESLIELRVERTHSYSLWFRGRCPGSSASRPKSPRILDAVTSSESKHLQLAVRNWPSRHLPGRLASQAKKSSCKRPGSRKSKIPDGLTQPLGWARLNGVQNPRRFWTARNQLRRNSFP